MASFLIATSESRNAKTMVFDTPYKKGDKGLQILAIKRFLGIDFGAGDFFDERTKKELIKFQNRNRDLIIEIGNLGSSQTEIAGIEIEFVDTDHPLWRAEKGQIGDATLKAMVMTKTGQRSPLGRSVNHSGISIAVAVKQTLDELAAIRTQLKGTNIDPLQALAERDPLETPTNPTTDGKFYYYTHISNLSRSDVNNRVGEETNRRTIYRAAERALQEGTRKIFDFYKRRKTWLVEGDQPNSTVFEPVLRSQNRIDASGLRKQQEFRMTVESQNLLQSMNAERNNTVSVFFGQSLEPGAPPIFASIKKIHSPTRRPGSKFKFTVMVRAEMFEKVPISNATTVQDVVETAEQIYETGREVYEVAEQVTSGVKNFSKTTRQVRRKATQAARKYSKKFARDAERLLQPGTGVLQNPDPRRLLNKLSAESVKNRIHSAAKARFRNLFSADNAAKNVASESFPGTQIYDLMFLNTYLASVQTKMIGFQKDLDKFKADGGALKPPVNPQKEADRLGSTFTGLTAILAVNGINILEAGLNGGKLQITFSEVKKQRSISSSQSILKVVGASITSITYLPKGEDPLVLTAGMEIVTGTAISPAGPPWNNPKTMAYFFHLDQMYRDGNGGLFGCNDAASSGAIGFFLKYTYPTPVVIPSRPKSLISVKMMPSIKSNVSKIEEELKSLGDQIDAIEWRDDVFTVERGKTYNINDMLPLGDLCTLEELFDEFLNKFDFPALFCKYAECLPDFPWPPEFQWDFDFTIPDIPDLPTFDPIAFIIPIIEAAIIDLIIAFLCGLVRAILDLLQAPDCQDLIDFGALAMSELMGDGKDNGDGLNDPTIADKAETFKKSQQALEEMDIPPEALSGAADIFDKISLALTPSEICSLFDGTATAQTMAIVKQIIINSESQFSEFMDSDDEIADFFEILGSFIDPAMCEKMSRLSNIVVGDDLCFEKDRKPLRQQLLEEGATPDEINRALEDAASKREGINRLLEKDPLKDLLADAGLGYSKPGVSPAGSGCPDSSNLGAGAGPYDNPNFSKLSKITTGTVLSSVEHMFKFDLKGYVPSFYSSYTRLMGPDDPEFDVILDLQYKHLINQILAQSAAGDPPEPPPALYKPGKLIVEDILGQPLRDSNGELVYDENNEVVREVLGKRPVSIEDGAPYILSDAISGLEIKDGGIDIKYNGDTTEQQAQKYFSTMQSEANELKKLLLDGQNQLYKTDYRIGTEDYSSFYEIDILNSVGVHGEQSTSAYRVDHFLQINIPSFQTVAPVENNAFNLVQVSDETAVVYRDNFIDRRTATVGSSLKDCYSIGSVRTNVLENYVKKLPERFATRRKRALDMFSDEGIPEISLRGGAFADMFIKSWESGIQTAIKTSEGNNPSYYLKLIDKKKLFNKIAFGAKRLGSGRSNLVAAPPGLVESFGKKNYVGDQWWRELKNGPYSLMVDRFLDKISNSISKSKFFDLAEMNTLNTRLTQEFKKVPQDDGSFCLEKIPPLIDFQELIDETLKDMQNSLCEPKNAPQNRDFSKPGPLEEANLKTLAVLYVLTFVIEYIFKQLYLAGRFDLTRVMEEKHVISLVKKSLESELGKTAAINIRSKILEMTNESSISTAIDIFFEKFVISKIGSLTKKISENGFKPEWSSFKDEYYHEILDDYERRLTAPISENDFKFDPTIVNEDLLRRDEPFKIPERVTVESFESLMQPTQRGKLSDKITTNISEYIEQNKDSTYISQEAGKDLNQGKFYLETYYKLDEDILRQLTDIIYNNRTGEKNHLHLVGLPMSYAMAVFHPAKYTGAFSLRDLEDLLLLFAPFGSNERESLYHVKGAAPTTIAGLSADIQNSHAQYNVGLQELQKFKLKNAEFQTLKRMFGLAGASQRITETQIGQKLTKMVLQNNDIDEDIIALKNRVLNGGVTVGLRLVFQPGVGDMMYANIPSEERKEYNPGVDFGTIQSSTDPRPSRSEETAAALAVAPAGRVQVRISTADAQQKSVRRVGSGKEVDSIDPKEIHSGQRKGIPSLEQGARGGPALMTSDLMPSLINTLRPLDNYSEAKTISDPIQRTLRQGAPFARAFTDTRVISTTEFGYVAPPFAVSSNRIDGHDFNTELQNITIGQGFDFGANTGPSTADTMRQDQKELLSTAVRDLGALDSSQVETGRYIPVSFDKNFNDALFGPHSLLSIVNKSYLASLSANNVKAFLDTDSLNRVVHADLRSDNYGEGEAFVNTNSEKAAILFGTNKLRLSIRETDDQRQTGMLFKDSTNFIYPTPIVEVEVPMDCLGQYVNYTMVRGNNDGASEDQHGYSAFNRPSCLVSDQEASYIKNFINRRNESDSDFRSAGANNAYQNIQARNKIELHDKYFDILVTKMFGYGNKDENNRRTKISPENEDMSYLFDFVFPLDRYTSLYFHQSLKIFKDNRRLDNMFVPTRGTILRIFNTISNVSSNSLDIGNQGDLLSENNSLYNNILSSQMGDGLAPEADVSLGDIAAMIGKMILMAVPTMIRGQAQFLDPGYKQMAQIFMENPCELPKGLTMGSLGGAAAKMGRGKQPNLLGGQNESRDKFMPITLGAPMDITKGIGWYLITAFPTFFTKGDFKPLLNSIKHVVGTFNSALGPEGYGGPLLPPGLLALAMPELPGEEASKKLKEANCNENQERTTEEFDEDGNVNSKVCDD